MQSFVLLDEVEVAVEAVSPLELQGSGQIPLHPPAATFLELGDDLVASLPSLVTDLVQGLSLGLQIVHNVICHDVRLKLVVYTKTE